MRILGQTHPKTKIVCTIGPSSNSESVLEGLAKAGMTCARLNFSHGTLDEHLAVIKSIRNVSRRIGREIAILQDLPGPKFRVGNIVNEPMQIRKGSIVSLSSKKQKARPNIIPLRSKELPRYIFPGATIFLSDGAIRLRAIRNTETEISCRCEIGGLLYSGKGINVPKLKKGLRTFTSADREYLSFGLEHDVDLVAVSFVRSASDVRVVKSFVEKKNKRAHVIAKIEKKDAIDDLEQIVEVSDGLMVARGDLGVENPIQRIPELQKLIISRCNAAGIPVITATQMLESMVNNPSPTRAEVTDVANAILDGTDAVMLSEETAVGKYPRECVSILRKVSLEAESLFSKKAPSREETFPFLDASDAMSFAAVKISSSVGASAIVTAPESGRIIPKISRFRPVAPIIAIHEDITSLRQSAIISGVLPIKTDANNQDYHDPEKHVAFLTGLGVLRKRDVVVVVSRHRGPAGGLTLYLSKSK